MYHPYFVLVNPWFTLQKNITKRRSKAIAEMLKGSRIFFYVTTTNLFFLSSYIFVFTPYHSTFIHFIHHHSEKKKKRDIFFSFNLHNNLIQKLLRFSGRIIFLRLRFHFKYFNIQNAFAHNTAIKELFYGRT